VLSLLRLLVSFLVRVTVLAEVAVPVMPMDADCVAPASHPVASVEMMSATVVVAVTPPQADERNAVIKVIATMAANVRVKVQTDSGMGLDDVHIPVMTRMSLNDVDVVMNRMGFYNVDLTDRTAVMKTKRNTITGSTRDQDQRKRRAQKNSC
jgi:hypothetical protein